MNLTTHGFIDYSMGLLLIFSPSLFVLPMGIPAVIAIGFGLFISVYSFFTHYDLGAVHWIPLRYHLSLDVLTGVFLAISPWLFGYSDTVWVPFVIFGAITAGAAIGTALINKTQSSKGKKFFVLRRKLI